MPLQQRIFTKAVSTWCVCFSVWGGKYPLFKLFNLSEQWGCCYPKDSVHTYSLYFFSLRVAVLRVLGVCSELVSYLRAEILSCKEKNELSQCQKTLNLPPRRLPSVPMARFPISRWIPWSLLKVRCLFSVLWEWRWKWILVIVSNWGVSALEASFVSLTTEWFPYKVTRRHLPVRSFYGDGNGVYVRDLKIQHSESWPQGLCQRWDRREHLLSGAGLHPSAHPTFLVRTVGIVTVLLNSDTSF